MKNQYEDPTGRHRSPGDKKACLHDLQQNPRGHHCLQLKLTKRRETAETLRQKSRLGRPELLFWFVVDQHRHVKTCKKTLIMRMTNVLITETKMRPPQEEEERRGRGDGGEGDQDAEGRG